MKENVNSMLIVEAYVDPKKSKEFERLQDKVKIAISTFPGLIQYKLEKPDNSHDTWNSIIVFDSIDHLDKWLKSPERQKILKEFKSIGVPSHLHTIYSPFDFWFDKLSPNLWKQSMLVLLALYPITFTLSVPRNILVKVGFPSWAVLFGANAVSVILLGYTFLPVVKRIFRWWLQADESNAITNAFGVFVVFVFYCLFLFFAWQISRILS